MAMVGGAASQPPHSAWPPHAQGCLGPLNGPLSPYAPYRFYSLYGVPSADAAPDVARDAARDLVPDPGGGGTEASATTLAAPTPSAPLGLGLGMGLGLGGLLGAVPSVPTARYPSSPATDLHGLVAPKVASDSLFPGFSFGAAPLGSPLGSPLASPVSPPCAPLGHLGLGGPLGALGPVYQQQAGPFIDNSGGAAAPLGAWDVRHRAAALPSPLAVNVKLDGRATASPARGTPLQSPQPSGLLSPAGANDASSTPRPDADLADRACQVAEVTTSGEQREASSSAGGVCALPIHGQNGADANGQSPALGQALGQAYGLLRDPASQFVLLAAPAPGLNIDAMPRPMLWSGLAPPLLLPPMQTSSVQMQQIQRGMLLDPMMSSSGSIEASMTICQALHTSRTVSGVGMTAHSQMQMQTQTHQHSMSSVSNVVTLPAMPAMPLPPLPMPPASLAAASAATPSCPPLLTVASMCHSSVECSATPWPTLTLPNQVPERDHAPEAIPPKCISDGESAIITQVADPSKQCSASVQTQMDSDASTNEFSPEHCGSPASDCQKETFTDCDGPDNDSPTESSSQAVEEHAKEAPWKDSKEELGAAHADRDRGPAPLLAEADSNGEQEQSAVPLISCSYEESPGNTEESTNVPDKPNQLDISGLELLYKSIEHMESLETKKSQEELAVKIEPVAIAPKPELHGLGLLCALAEQRIQEEINSESEPCKQEEVRSGNISKPSSDVNRNYRSPQSEQDARRYLATRTESANANVTTVSFKMTPSNDSLEMQMRNRLAELQRMYKETQKELSRLTPRKNSTEESSSGSHIGSPHSKRTPAKSSQARKKKAPSKKRTPLKPEVLSDPLPPILERVTDVAEAPLPKLTWSRLDAPPTLTPHKPPEDLPNCNPASFKLNLVKLPATKDHKRRWSVDTPSARVSTETQHADDEDSDGLWSDFISKPPESLNGNRKTKPLSEISSLHSSSKRRKVGRPKRHLDNTGNGHHTTETIVPKQPRNKANLVSFLLASKSAGAPGKFPNTEHHSKENSKISTGDSSPEHRPKIRPKLKAEVKVKETWEDEDILDWSTPKPQLPSHPLRPLDLVFECMEEISANGREKNSGLKRNNDDEDVDWLPKKPKTPIASPKPIIVPNFTQHKQSEKPVPLPKPKKPVVPPRERRQSTEKHLKKPVCSSVHEESMPPKVSNNPESCVLTAEILESADLPVRTLTAQGGLFYAGMLNAVMPPDLYSIVLHGERASRPNIYSREEILQDTILEVRPTNVESLSVGTRLCAYWSQQTKCLYPGVVAPPLTPDPSLDGDFVTVEFDDGDSGQIRIQDVRLLPPDYPFIEFDPNPLLSLTKRRRRNSEKSVESKDRRVSADSTASSNISVLESPKDDNKAELSSVEINEDESKRLKKKRKEKVKKWMLEKATEPSSESKKHKHKKHKHKHRHRHSSSGSSSESFVKTDQDGAVSDDFSKPIVKEDVGPILVAEEISSVKEEMKDSEENVKQEEVEKEDTPNGEVEDTGKEAEAPNPLKSDDEISSFDDDQAKGKKPKKKHERQNSSETSKMAAFLPPRKLWSWSGKGYKRQGAKGRKKEFFKCIQRDKEQINVGDCAVFLSTNSPDRPYIGRIESLWETYNGMMVVRVKWFYHPEETEGCPSLKYPGGLFQSDHADDNDVQTISHRCEVLSLGDYEKKLNRHSARPAHLHGVYYQAGVYDPKNLQIKLEKGVAG